MVRSHSLGAQSTLEKSKGDLAPKQSEIAAEFARKTGLATQDSTVPQSFALI